MHQSAKIDFTCTSPSLPFALLHPFLWLHLFLLVCCLNYEQRRDEPALRPFLSFVFLHERCYLIALRVDYPLMLPYVIIYDEKNAKTPQNCNKRTNVTISTWLIIKLIAVYLLSGVSNVNSPLKIVNRFIVDGFVRPSNCLAAFKHFYWHFYSFALPLFRWYTVFINFGQRLPISINFCLQCELACTTIQIDQPRPRLIVVPFISLITCYTTSRSGDSSFINASVQTNRQPRNKEVSFAIDALPTTRQIR